MEIGSKLPMRLRTLRKEANLTQAKVANILGCTVKTYRGWEKQDHLPNTIDVINLAQLYGVSTDYLIGETNYRNIGNKEICEIMGITEDAAIALCSFKGRVYRDNLSSVLSSKAFSRFVISLLSAKAKTESMKTYLDELVFHFGNYRNSTQITVNENLFGACLPPSDIEDNLQASFAEMISAAIAILDETCLYHDTLEKYKDSKDIRDAIFESQFRDIGSVIEVPITHSDYDPNHTIELEIEEIQEEKQHGEHQKT